MNRAPVVLVLLWSSFVLAANYPSGQVMVVEDPTGAAHDTSNLPPLQMLGMSLCGYASKGLYTQFPDQYDGVVMFTTHPMNTMDLGIQNTMLGNIIRQTDQGISEQGFANIGGNPAVTHGSPAKLSQCVWMGSLGQLPANPDDQATTLFGGFIPLGMGVTGAELMGHEYGHHWLLWASYDKNDGKGKRYLLRGDTSASPQDPAQPNGHWNHYSNAGSVMYGSFVTKTSPGNYKLEGGVRKYNHFDQYFMGLRAPHEVSPMMIVDDGSNSDRGAAVQPLWRGASQTMTGNDFTVDIQDVIRAIGPRNPSTATSQKCWRVAFVLVGHGGHVPTAAEIAKVDAYRVRFSSWFNFATDGRGWMDTSLTGPTNCPVTPTDGGVVVTPDAGTPVVDAGTPDAGRPVVDAGTSDAGTAPVVDAGTNAPPDAGNEEVVDAGKPPGKWETLDPGGTSKLKDRCGCDAGAGALGFALLSLVVGLRRRR